MDYLVGFLFGLFFSNLWKFIKKLEANNYRLINLSEDNDYDYWSEE
jgi:hypothetical protein